MNALISNQQLTMSSLELLAVINNYRVKEDKPHMRHDNFMAKIKDELEEDALKFQGIYLDNSNKESKCYNLPEDECFQMAMRESKSVRKNAVKKIRELMEAKPTPIALTQDEQLLALAQGVIKLTAERDEAIKTKALISDKRTATLMNKASQDSKRIKKLEGQIQSEGDHLSVIAAGLPQRVDTETKPNVQTWRLLKALSVQLKHEILKSTCPRYGEVNTYHIDVIEEFKSIYL